MIGSFLYRPSVKNFIFRLTFILMLLAICWQTAMHLIDYFHGVYGYENGCINDMLVNYEGGFVRRGLFGELLFLARSVVPFSVADAMVILYYLGVILLTALLVYIFKHNNWSLYILPFPICLYVYLCDPYFLTGRRDCWLLLLSCLCFYLYHQYVIKERVVYLIWCVIVQIFALLLHEASVFFILPVIAIHDFSRQYNILESFTKAFFSTISHWWVIVLAVLIIIMQHGDESVVRGFWLSWAPYIDVTEELITDSYVSNTLASSFLYNFKVALWPLWSGNIFWKVPAWPFNLYLFVCVYYLVTRFDTIHLGHKRVELEDRIQLSNIVIVLFIGIFIFMAFVSCDWGRDFPYWVISSLFFFHFFRSADGSFTFLIKWSTKFQGWIDHSRFLNSAWGYYILLITLPLGFMGASISSMFPFVPLQLKHLLIDGHYMLIQ